MAINKSVNLDAMFPREDLAIQQEIKNDSSRVREIRLADLDQRVSHILSSLRKPDFQRETTHWTPEQVVSLIESFMDGDLIPAVILWESSLSYTFVIDGGHRLSALRAWVEDDYGDQTISRKYLDHKITKAQIEAAERTRSLVSERIGSFSLWEKRAKEDPKTLGLDKNQQHRLGRFKNGSITIQWIDGDVDKAEYSFYKINQQGTPLDDTEELLIKNRRKAVPIAARAIIRSGGGNKYWSRFSDDHVRHIEELARQLHEKLFQPEYTSPIKTLDLPLGGLSGVRNALPLLIELLLVSSADAGGNPDNIENAKEDIDGKETCNVLERALRLINTISGNERGSLGLHPAVYFYSTTGKFSQALFMGVITLFSGKLSNNDKSFFQKFTNVRAELEQLLVNKKEIFLMISNQTRSQKRYRKIADVIEFLIKELNDGRSPNDEEIVSSADIKFSIFVSKSKEKGDRFTKETKAAVLIRRSIETSIKCSICGALLDPGKSLSYDHIQDLSLGGESSEDNCALTHPYCNQSYKYHKK